VARISGKRLRLATIELPENYTQGTANRGRVRRGDKTSNHVRGGEDEMERNIGRMLMAAKLAAWWLLKLLATMLLGALLVGAGALVLGLLPGGVDTLWALKVGAFLGAGFGAIMSFGPGSARGVRAREQEAMAPTDRKGETNARSERS
jgi:hypothetical protein